MTQYIDKSAIVAEIKKEIKDIYAGREYVGIPSWEEREIDGLEKAIKILNTFEVKEVDLEKEVEDWVKTGPHTSYPWCTIPDAIRITAEHFFELGLKAKGE